MRVIFYLIGLLLLASGPVLAAEPCKQLCKAEFYLSATPQSLQQIIDQGVDVNARDDIGKSALHWVANANPELISALLAAGAEVNAVDQWDRMPLHFVAAAGSAENVSLLLQAGAMLDAKTANDWTPLHGAAKFGSAENIMILLEAGADASARTEMGETAFDLSPGNAKLAGSKALEILEERQ